MEKENTNTSGVAVLSESQVAEFHERGYLIADFSLDESLLDRIVQKLQPLYPEDYQQNPTIPARIQDGWKTVDEVRQLARNANIARALQQLLGRESLPFQTLNFPIGTRQFTHSDTIHFNSIPSNFMVGVWVALEDIDEDNGPLLYYPGSHKLHEYSMHDFDLEPGYHNYHNYEERIQQVVEREQLEGEYGIIKKGDVLIWHANLLHGGAPQKDLERSRHSQVTHYYFADCKYYTPMNSTAEQLNFRDPFWIPESADYQLPKRHSLFSRLARKLGITQ
ncbi:MAG: phytanoyl-CoA dioxygenase [SAR86 cluster bacterium]|uniref:Phytanoyl-CoA dioxygenase n=1 Tax=SAR86 cluster bacterium TaxID=2030880 RepID=A0A2A4X3G7_9GAMM|nr:MAG: phytanoyl-CoA dioxygenase [SAR86 cluster bacterium]